MNFLARMICIGLGFVMGMFVGGFLLGILGHLVGVSLGAAIGGMVGIAVGVMVGEALVRWMEAEENKKRAPYLLVRDQIDLDRGKLRGSKNVVKQVVSYVSLPILPTVFNSFDNKKNGKNRIGFLYNAAVGLFSNNLSKGKGPVRSVADKPATTSIVNGRVIFK